MHQKIIITNLCYYTQPFQNILKNTIHFLFFILFNMKPFYVLIFVIYINLSSHPHHVLSSVYYMFFNCDASKVQNNDTNFFVFVFIILCFFVCLNFSENIHFKQYLLKALQFLASI